MRIAITGNDLHIAGCVLPMPKTTRLIFSQAELATLRKARDLMGQAENACMAYYAIDAKYSSIGEEVDEALDRMLMYPASYLTELLDAHGREGISIPEKLETVQP